MSDEGVLFNRATDIAFASNGDFYVSDGCGNSRVVKFSRDGRFLKTWAAASRSDMITASRACSRQRRSMPGSGRAATILERLPFSMPLQSNPQYGKS